MNITVKPSLDLFPQRVICSVNSDFDTYRNEMIEWMYDYTKRQESWNRSNQGGYQSPDNFYHEPSFEKFMYKIAYHINSTVNSYLDHECAFPPADEMSIMNMWFNINGKNAYNMMHVHPGCTLAGVLWVKSVDNTCIRFEAPDAYGRALLENRTNEAFAPKDGHMFLFPSYLPHAVDPNPTNEDRISISFNINRV